MTITKKLLLAVLMLSFLSIGCEVQEMDSVQENLNETKAQAYPNYTPPPYGTKKQIPYYGKVGKHWVVVSENPSRDVKTIMYAYGKGATYGRKTRVTYSSPVPTHWVITKAFVNNRDIMFVLGARFGQSVQISNASPIWKNWVVTRNGIDGRTIMYVGGPGVRYGRMVYQISFTSPIPEHWVIKGSNPTSGQNLMYVKGARVGTKITVADSSPVPPGWFIVGRLLGNGMTLQYRG